VIVRSLAKIAVVVASAGFALIELGSPLWTRAQLDGTAHDAADDAARMFVRTNSREAAYAAALEDVTERGARLDDLFFDEAGTVHVTVSKRAWSYLLDNFEQTRDWYDVRLSASAAPPEP
jgi:hypothetical protein